MSNTVNETAQTISVYIYINGDYANVYTDNIAALSGTVELTLKAFVNDHNPK